MILQDLVSISECTTCSVSKKHFGLRGFPCVYFGTFAGFRVHGCMVWGGAKTLCYPDPETNIDV